MTKSSIGIIGCGWLGKALTEELVSQQHLVTVSTQHKEKIDDLKQLGAQVECFSSSEQRPSQDDFQLSLFNKNCLIVAIPPGIRQGKVDYPDKIKHVVTLAESGGIKQLIMISSTAIYDRLTGDINENAVLDLSAQKTSIINSAEEQALAFNGNTIILRLSGLVGPDRHPGKFLRGDRLLFDPQATTNLIHQKDAVGLLIGLINAPNQTAIYNGSSNTHVSKREYYEQAALAIGLPKPLFDEVEPHNSVDTNMNSVVLNKVAISNKIIMSHKIRAALNYTFQYDDLLYWLENA